MQRAYTASENASVSEMAIVDTFTKLIFGEEDHYSTRELLIIQAFRAVDLNVAVDGHREMGEYLRALGVKEMIQLVSRGREQLVDGLQNLPGTGQAMIDTASHLALNRRAH